jgi:hypothetical protein
VRPSAPPSVPVSCVNILRMPLIWSVPCYSGWGVRHEVRLELDSSAVQGVTRFAVPGGSSARQSTNAFVSGARSTESGRHTASRSSKFTLTTTRRDEWVTRRWTNSWGPASRKVAQHLQRVRRTVRRLDVRLRAHKRDDRREDHGYERDDDEHLPKGQQRHCCARGAQNDPRVLESLAGNRTYGSGSSE